LEVFPLNPFSAAVRYAIYGVALAAIFSVFVACGASIYSVPLADDHVETDNSDQFDLHSPHYGIHAREGWIKLPIRYRLSNEISKADHAAITRAMNLWESVTCGSGCLFEFAGYQKSEFFSRYGEVEESLADSTNDQYLEGNWGKTTKKNFVVATTVYKKKAGDDQTIATSDIIYNKEHFLFGDALNLKSSDQRPIVDLESLALHELGHFLGLNHMPATVDSGSIMNPSLIIGEGAATRHVSVGDIERIQKIYGCSLDDCSPEILFEKQFEQVSRQEDGSTAQ
jgi:hypothetical protein